MRLFAKGFRRDAQKIGLLFLAGLAPYAFAACGGGEHEHEAEHKHEEEHGHAGENEGEHAEHGHEHTAPHGGALIVLGDEFAHVELTLDAATGKLTAYVLDSEAEHAVRLTGGTLEFALKGGSLKADLAAALAPEANTLTGETSEETSQFSGTFEELKGADKFEGVLVKVTIKGETFENVAFKFPEGNE